MSGSSRPGTCCAAVSAPSSAGTPRYLDIVGVNFYHDGQWELEGEPLHWAQDSARHTRWLPLHRQLERVWARYQRPLFVSETSHFGVGRAHWLREVVSEVQMALASGIPVGGVCLYPILDRPDWNVRDYWHNAGLWDLVPERDGRLARVINRDYADELRVAQEQISAPTPVSLGLAHPSLGGKGSGGGE